MAKSLWQPQTLRSIQEFVNNATARWDKASKAEKASGQLINPDEPIVLRVPNPEWSEGEDGPYAPDDEGNETHLCFHVESHDGAMFTGMEMDYGQFWSNGRRRK